MESRGGVRLSTLRVASRLAALSLGLVAALLVSAPNVQAQSRARRASARPVVVELFTAQGCAACPQANQMLAEIAERRGVIALTFPVDYWDYLGWRDTFAMPDFTARQRAYLGRLKLKDLYTPEVVVAGRREAPAVDMDRVDKLIDAERAARRRGPTISVSRHGRRVTVGAGQRLVRTADVWLVRYDPMRRSVRVRAGENAGKNIIHVNVVRELTRLGGWNARARNYTVEEAEEPGLKSVVIVQGGNGGPILSARTIG
jgi:hypothetical protein